MWRWSRVGTGVRSCNPSCKHTEQPAYVCLANKHGVLKRDNALLPWIAAEGDGGGTHRPSGMFYKHCPTAGTEPRAQRREVKKTTTEPQLNAFWGIMPSILSVLMELGKPSASCLTPETLGWGARALESPGSLSGFNGAAPCQLGEQGLPGLGRGQKIPESTTLCLSVSSVAWPVARQTWLQNWKGEKECGKQGTHSSFPADPDLLPEISPR